MPKKLSAVGDNLGLVIDRPILDLLGIDKDTLLEFETDGQALIIRPATSSSETGEVVAAADEIMDAHEATFETLSK